MASVYTTMASVYILLLYLRAAFCPSDCQPNPVACVKQITRIYIIRGRRLLFILRQAN